MLTVTIYGESLLFNLNARFEQEGCYKSIRTIDSDRGYVITFDMLKRKHTISKFDEDDCWTYTDFNNKVIPDKTQSLLFNASNTNFCVLPLCTDKFTTQIFSGSAEEIKISLGAKCEGYNDMSGDILVAAVDNNAYKCVERAVKKQCETELFVTPLRCEKVRPLIVDGFGWCTWDACYYDVTEAKIREKMEEFREKNISQGWVLIDDGWFSYNGKRMVDLYANKEKFPNGLKGTVDMLKKEYGVKYVGLWHSFNAYWYGFEEGSKAYLENKDLLIKTNGNVILPDYTDSEKAFKFFDKWHTYISGEGIDFLKIDTQGTLAVFTAHNISHTEATRNIQLAVEKSVKKHFNCQVINCMAMGMENTQARPYTNMLRNSIDFWPKQPNSFKKHIIQNAYNAVFNNMLYFLDFDMWWTNNNFSEQSAALRAISGGPVYISDEIGATVKKYVIPLMDENGIVPVCDDAAMPTPDCLFNDCINNDRVLKLWNTINNTSLVGAFNISETEGGIDFEISLEDVKKRTSDEYVAYCYFSKKFYKLNISNVIRLSLEKDQCEIVSLYPVVDRKIMLGDISKYVSAGFERRTINVDDICFE